MTEPGIYYPPQLTAQQLDVFLLRGWYRMGQGIFTTSHIIQENIFYRVYWIRYPVSQLRLTKSQQKIQHNNRHFTSVIKPLHITTELEELYTQYKSTLAFDPAQSVSHWLYMERSYNIFDTYIIEVRDKNILIAAGIFDKGHNSIAGIMNFYNPTYKKYSLGKLLMLLKIEYAKTNNMPWYYPGYIVAGYPKFDYKLFIDKSAAQMFLPALNGWCVYNESIVQALENIYY